ncbi:MAG: CDP-alcohol phosphatidyltransferase family protein [Nitrospira bacterium HGW-Nitrospira-1]|nr:MAG: CDP-alcohol phosphatidyltransferase family protein [Nitrospira bacterium HGW-Nitrospira-1]
MLSEKYGHAFDKPLGEIARKIPLSPNSLSIIGFIITLFACCILSFDLLTGGLLILVGALFDVLDGVVARINNKITRFGAFLDSVLDRYSDAFILLAIAYNLGNVKNTTGVILCLGTLLGSFLISYSRARAEGIGEECKHGIMERPERLILISLGAISGFMLPVLWVLVVLTNITVIQRIYYVWNATNNEIR